MRRHGVAGGGDEGVALQDLAIEGAESSLDSEDPSGKKKRDWNHGLSMGYPWVIQYFMHIPMNIHIPFIVHSYSIHIPFIFRSYSIHIPFIFH